MVKRALICMVVLLVALQGCDDIPKDPNEAVKKAFLDYLAAQKSKDFEAAYKMLHKETRGKITLDEWLDNQVNGLDLVVPSPDEVKVTKISINLDKAEIEIKYYGYDPQKVSEVMLTSYLANLTLMPDELNEVVKKKLLKNKAQYMKDVASSHILKKEGKRWKLIIRGVEEKTPGR